MGRTCRRVAEHGAEDFYTGELAARIVADMERSGGLLSAEDLAAAAPDDTEPLWGSYRGHRIATNRPPGGGVMVLEMLNILEHFDLAAMGHNSPEYIAAISEAMKIATVDKDTRIGDPRFFETPIEELTSKEYGARLAARVRGGEKTHVPRLDAGGGGESKDTTHVCVVDGDGSCVSLTHSLGRPSGVVTEGLGFMYNGCMGVFDPRPGRAGSLAPGKARFTAMCPTILFDEDGPWYVVGAPGGTYITMGVLQAILNAVDFGMSAQESVSAPGSARPPTPSTSPTASSAERNGRSRTWAIRCAARPSASASQASTPFAAPPAAGRAAPTLAATAWPSPSSRRRCRSAPPSGRPTVPAVRAERSVPTAIRWRRFELEFAPSLGKAVSGSRPTVPHPGESGGTVSRPRTLPEIPVRDAAPRTSCRMPAVKELHERVLETDPSGPGVNIDVRIAT